VYLYWELNGTLQDIPRTANRNQQPLSSRPESKEV